MLFRSWFLYFLSLYNSFRSTTLFQLLQLLVTQRKHITWNKQANEGPVDQLKGKLAEVWAPRGTAAGEGALHVSDDDD